MNLRQQADVESCTVQGRGSQLYGFLVLLQPSSQSLSVWLRSHCLLSLRVTIYISLLKIHQWPSSPNQAKSYRTFGTGGRWCPCSPPFWVGGSSLSPCLPDAGFKAYIPTHSGESYLGKRDASSTTIRSRCFLIYRLLSCESSRDLLTPMRYTNK